MWDRRWTELTQKLDCFEPSADPNNAVADAALFSVLTKGVKLVEILQKGAEMLERWDLDPVTLARLMRVHTWDVDTVAYWLGITARQVRKILKVDGPVPKDALVTAVVPIALEGVKGRAERAWILTVAELVAATT